MLQGKGRRLQRFYKKEGEIIISGVSKIGSGDEETSIYETAKKGKEVHGILLLFLK